MRLLSKERAFGLFMEKAQEHISCPVLHEIYQMCRQAQTE